MDVIKCCMIIGWTYRASSFFILFASNLKWLVAKIPEGIFSQLYFYAHFTRASKQKGESSCYLPKVLVLDKSSSLGNLRIMFLNGEVVSPPTPTFVYLSQDSHNKICNIYDIQTHLQPPFQNFYEHKV